MQAESERQLKQDRDIREAKSPREELSEAHIRRYRPEDRAAVRQICCDTGLMGDTIDPHFGSPELFADYWMNYYTDFEPESAFVAELDGKVIGYLVGCVDTSIQQETQSDIIVPKIRRRLLMFGYKIDRRFFSFVWRYLRSMWRGEFVEESITDYPAHLHMNIAEGYRSQGLGSRLLSEYFEYLRQNKVRGVHLGTTTGNKLAVPFYKKWGFRLVSSRPLTIYDGIVPEKVEELFFTRETT
jgi:GNAT superfamily N-acetyltransferase